jgi:nicotinamidase-related amidase
VRAWRFSYNARGIIEMPNHLKAADTALIVVHPWGIDDGSGWDTPEPCGVADFCTPWKNHFAAKHTHNVVNPFLKSLRGKVAFVMYSLPGNQDPIRKKIYRSIHGKPTDAERAEGMKELDAKLKNFDYTGQPLKKELKVSKSTAVVDYFKEFPGLDAGPHFDRQGFWQQPIPVTRDIETEPDDVVIYDGEGYPPLRDFLKKNHIRHVLLAGYACDMCYEKTTAGFRNLSPDFDTFLIGDATLATFPANDSPRYATNASISFASLQHLITQISWIKYEPAAHVEAK